MKPIVPPGDRRRMDIRLLLTDPIPAGFAERLRGMLPAGVSLDVVADASEMEFARGAATADVLVVAHRQIGAHELALAPNVKLVHKLGAGYDNLDTVALHERGVAAAYTPGVNAGAVAEHTIMLMLAVLKRLAEAGSATRANRWPDRQLIDAGIGELAGASVGLVGFGATGRAVAERLVGFGVELRYTSAHRADAGVESPLRAGYLPLGELLGWSSIVSMHVPLTDQTRHLIGAPQLARMRPSSILINTSRGEIVDESALLEALDTGHLAGAGLDVLEHEQSGGNPFAAQPHVIVTPHIAGASRGAVARGMQIMLTNISRFVQGQPPIYPVPGTEQQPLASVVQ